MNDDEGFYDKISKEDRLGQHKGFYDIIKELEISKNDFDIFRKLYKRLWDRTIFLVNLSINVYYKETDINTKELLESAYNVAVYYLDEMYQGREERNKYDEDLKVIKEYYERVVKQGVTF